MIVLETLVIKIASDSSAFTRGLATSAAAATAWAGGIKNLMAGAIPTASIALATNLKKTLDVGANVSALAKTGLAVSDLARYTKTAGVGVDRLTLAFTRDAVKATALREKIDQNVVSMRKWRDVTERARFGVFAADLGMFAARVGLLGEKILPGIVGAMASTTRGAIHLAAGIGRVTEGTIGVVGNLRQTVTHLNRARDATQGAAVRSVELWSAMYYARKVVEPIRLVTGGMLSIASGTARAAIGVGRLAVSLASAVWRTAVGSIKALWSGFTGLLGVLGPITGAVGLAAAGMTALLVKSAASAAHLNETFNKVKQTFNGYADGVLTASRDMAQAFGTNQREFLDGASSLGALLQGFGYAEKDSAKLGTNLAKLAADVSAYRDIPFLEALGKIRSGLSGEAEPLKALGILVDEGAVKSYAYANGLTRIGAELSQTAKGQARVALVTQGLSKDMGALGREATGPAAQISAFWGRLDGLMNTIGTTFAPVLGGVLQGLNVGLETLRSTWENNSQAVLGWLGVSAEAMTHGGAGIQIVTNVVGKLGEAFGWVASQATGAFASVTRIAARIVDHMADVMKAIGVAKETMSGPGSGDKWFNSAFDMQQQSKAIEKWAGGLDAKREEWKTWSEDVAGNIAKAFKESSDDIANAARRAARNSGMKNEENVNEVGKPFESVKSAHANLFAGAFEFGSKDAYSVEARHFFGSQSNEFAKNTAENTRRTVEALDRINDALRNNEPTILGGYT